MSCLQLFQIAFFRGALKLLLPLQPVRVTAELGGVPVACKSAYRRVVSHAAICAARNITKIRKKFNGIIAAFVFYDIALKRYWLHSKTPRFASMDADGRLWTLMDKRMLL